MAHIGLIVEGRGDQEALPVLLRLHLNEVGRTDVVLAKPFNVKGKGKLMKAGELERFVRLAATEPGAVGVLVLCDSNSDPPEPLFAGLKNRCAGLGLPGPVAIALAVREFENWIVASAETVADESLDLEDWEGSGAEARIRSWRAPRKYVKPLHQAGLTSRIDLALARGRCPWLNRMIEDFDGLLPEAADQGP